MNYFFHVSLHWILGERKKTDLKSVMILSAKTKQLIFDLKISSERLQDAAFSGNYVYTLDTSGATQQFDLRTRTTVSTLADSGSYNTTCVSVPNTGSYSGIVNVYDLHQRDRLQ